MVAMAYFMAFDGEVYEALFEKPVKAGVVVVNQFLFNFSSCYALFAALEVLATLKCLNDAMAGFTFTDCQDKLSDIELGAWLVFAGSVMSLIMVLILSALHKFGPDELLDKEESELQYVCLEALGR